MNRPQALGYLTILLCCLAPSCSVLEPEIPSESPVLLDFEEPLAFHREPDDEDQRLALDKGGFTGLYVKDSRQGLEAMGGEPEGVLVARVVENSPGAKAGFQVDDLILEVDRGGASGAVLVNWPSAWRQAELEAEPGTRWTVLIDRAGEEIELPLLIVERVAAPQRAESERFKETMKVGIALRRATEVEARGAGLGPGAGAVVVGMARSSPWRAAGVQMGDLITMVDGRPLEDLTQVVARIEAASPGESFELEILRANAEGLTIDVAVSERNQRFHSFNIPIIFRHERGADTSDTSLLYGLLGYEDTGAAWQVRLLWFLTLSGGDADTLEEITP